MDLSRVENLRSTNLEIQKDIVKEMRNTIEDKEEIVLVNLMMRETEGLRGGKREARMINEIGVEMIGILRERRGIEMGKKKSTERVTEVIEIRHRNDTFL